MQLEHWILDTLSEGQYSYVEICNYITKGGVSNSEFFQAIKSLSGKRYIETHLRTEEDSMELADFTTHKDSIRDMLRIVDIESASWVRHYLELSERGVEYIRECGFGVF
jgi:hemerythrin